MLPGGSPWRNEDGAFLPESPLLDSTVFIVFVLFLGPVWYFSIFGPNADPSRGYLARSAARTAESLGLSMVWFTVALPLTITIIFIHLLAQIVAPNSAPATGRCHR